MSLLKELYRGNSLGSSPIFILCLLTCLILCSPSCVTMGETRSTSDEIRTSIDELRLSSTNNTQSIEELRAENDKLKGEIEKLNFTIKQLEISFDEKLKTQAHKEVAKPNLEKETKTEIEADTDIASIDIDKRYKTARKFHDEKNYVEAERYYASMQNSPSKWYEERAMYYMGIMYYDNKEYGKSVVALQEFIDKYPGSKNVPSAIYTQGESLLALDRADEAKLFFEDLITKFPRSNEAKEAKKRLKK